MVSGTVTFNGKPVQSGMIRFLPIAESQVPMGGAGIIDGKYKVDVRGGVPVGTHKIEIEAYKEKSGELRMGPITRGTPLIQYLPDRYNVNSNMRVTIEPGSDEIVKNFELND